MKGRDDASRVPGPPSFRTLPRRVRDATERLPRTAAGILHHSSDTAGRTSRRFGISSQIQLARQHVQILVDYLESPECGDMCRLALLSDTRMCNTLVALLAVGLRIPWTQQDNLTRVGDMRGLEYAEQMVYLMSAITSCIPNLLCPPSQQSQEASVLQRRLALAVLRSDTLQAWSRQLAAAAELLRQVEDSPPAERQQGQRQQRQDRLNQAFGPSMVVLSILGGVLTSLLGVGEASLASKSWAFLNELARQLASSSVLEHLACLLLQISLAKILRGREAAHVRSLQVAQLQACTFLKEWRREVPPDTGSHLDQILSGRCVQHAVLLYAVAVLRVADGGSSHGLPQSVLDHVGALLPDADSSFSGSSSDEGGGVGGWRRSLGLLKDDLVRASLSAATGILSLPTRARPPGDRAALGLLLRISRAAVPAATALAMQIGGAASPAALPHAGTLALGPLQHAYQAFRGTSAWAAHRAEWWRLAVGSARIVPALGILLLDVLRADLQAANVAKLDALPVAPLPEFEAALSAGMVPCVERWLRRWTRDPESPDAKAVRSVAASLAEPSLSLLIVLLAYADERQAAALVVTMIKQLRRLAAQANLGGGPGYRHAVPTRFLCGLMSLGKVVWEAGRVPPGCERLVPLFAYAGCIMLEATVVVRRWALAHSQPTSVSHGAALVAFPVVQMFAAKSMPSSGGDASGATDQAGGACMRGAHGLTAEGDGADASESSGSSGGTLEGAGSGGAGGSGEDGSLRKLLLEGLEVIALLDELISTVAAGAVMELVGPTAGRTDLGGGPDGSAGTPLSGLNFEVGRSVICTASAVAAAFPREVRAALAPPSDAVASSSAESNPAESPRTEPAFVDLTLEQWPCGARSLMRWDPAMLRAQIPELVRNGLESIADLAELLAAQVERWRAGDGDDGELLKKINGHLESSVRIARAFPSPAEVKRQLPRTCANPGCANLDGDSEADLRLRGCSLCGEVGYCSRECQVAHWRAGHKTTCKGWGIEATGRWSAATALWPSQGQ